MSKPKANNNKPAIVCLEEGWLTVWADFAPTMLPHSFDNVGLHYDFTSLSYDPLPDWHEQADLPFIDRKGNRYEHGYVWYLAQFWDPEHEINQRFCPSSAHEPYRIYVCGGDDSSVERRFSSLEEMNYCLSLLKRWQPITAEQFTKLGFRYY